MKIRCGIASFAIVIGLLVLPLRLAFGQNAAIHILVSNGVKTVIDEIRPEWERAAGHPLALEYGTTAALKGRVELVAIRSLFRYRSRPPSSGGCW